MPKWLLFFQLNTGFSESFKWNQMCKGTNRKREKQPVTKMSFYTQTLLYTWQLSYVIILDFVLSIYYEKSLRSYSTCRHIVLIQIRKIPLYYSFYDEYYINYNRDMTARRSTYLNSGWEMYWSICHVCVLRHTIHASVCCAARIGGDLIICFNKILAMIKTCISMTFITEHVMVDLSNCLG